MNSNADSGARRRHLAELLQKRGRAAKAVRRWRDEPFTRHVNPQLARMLHGVGLDTAYVRGEGSWLWDAEGNRYLDFTGAYGALPFGHTPERIWSAMAAFRESAEPVFAQPSLLRAAGELAGRLTELAPRGLDRVVFANSGAESVEVAIKIARSATGRLRVLSTDHSFHGKTLGALSATGRPSYQEEFGAPIEGFTQIPFGDADALEQALEGGEFAAFIVEPIQGEGGVNVAPPGYLQKARDLCTEHGTLFILDEVQTGLGRTGRLFAAERHGVSPDIMTLAKALGGGVLPTAAVLTRSDLVTEGFAFRHTSTFGGNSLSARVGLRVLELLTDDDHALLRRVEALGERLREGLEKIRDDYPGVITDVRGEGFLLGVEFTDDINAFGGQGLLGSLAADENLAMVLCGYLLNAERIRLAPTLFGARVLRVEPPLTATEEECDHFLEGLRRAVRLVWNNDAGTLVGHLAGRRPEPGRAPAHPYRGTPPHHPPEPEERRFAFVVHPLHTDMLRELDESLDRFTTGELDRLMERFDAASCILNPAPFVVGAAPVRSATGARAHCELIGLPYTAERLLGFSGSKATRVIAEAVELGVERGAELVGLGAYSSIVTANATTLPDFPVPITTGNAFTAASAAQGVLDAAELRGVDLGVSRVAVIGASGSIGSMVARQLAAHAGTLDLVGNPTQPQRARRALHAVTVQIAEELRRHGGTSPAAQIAAEARSPEDAAQALIDSGTVTVGTDAQAAVRRSGIVVTATSSPHALLTPEMFAPDAIVCDISEPSNVPPLAEHRPDVLLFDGGIVALPGLQDLGVRYGLESGHAYACMTETMLIALSGEEDLVSVGSTLTTGSVTRLRELAAVHGFENAALRLWRSF